MGFETVWQFREVELLIETDAPAPVLDEDGVPVTPDYPRALLTISTEMPGSDIAQRHAVTFDTELTTTGRATVNIRLPGHIKGALFLPKITTTGAARIYGGRV